MAIRLETKGLNNKVYGFEKSSGMMCILVFIEQFEGNREQLQSQLLLRLPKALIPEIIISIPHFPLNSNGKIDKSALFTVYSKLIYD